MAFRIERSESIRKGFDPSEYLIYKGDRLVARYRHDFRLDDHEIEFVSGLKESWPVGRVTEFLEGGGPQPLRLSSRAIAYLDAKVP